MGGTTMKGTLFVKTFREFEKSSPNTFSESAAGQYLRNRLEKAFQAGVDAAEAENNRQLKPIIDGISEKLKLIEEYTAWQIHANQRFKVGQRVEFSRKAMKGGLGPGKRGVTKGKLIKIADSWIVVVRLDGYKAPRAYHHSFFNPVSGPKLF
jgi:hypothetical protein